MGEAMPKFDYETGEVFYRGKWMDIDDYDSRREAEDRQKEDGDVKDQILGLDQSRVRRI